MSEPKPDYEAETEEALALLGVGYDDNQPAVIVSAPRKDIALQEEGLEEYKVWGWVKKSAKFLFHIRKLKGAKLAIFDVITLTIDENGETTLSLVDLAKLSGYSRSEVAESVQEMQEMGYLSVKKVYGKSNAYRPLFVARGEASPISGLVQKNDQSSLQDGHPSSPAIQNATSSIKELKRVKKEDLKGIQAAIFGDRPATQEDIDFEKPEHSALVSFEAAFKIENGNIPWHKTKPEWTRLRKKLVEKHQSDPDYFKKYLIWYNDTGKFVGGQNVQQLRRDPAGFILALNIFDAAHAAPLPGKSTVEETRKKIESEDWRKRS